MRTTIHSDRVEAAAQLLHERRHRLGYGQTCSQCRELAAATADILETEAVDPR